MTQSRLMLCLGSLSIVMALSASARAQTTNSPTPPVQDLLRKAEAGDPASQFALAGAYLEGQGVKKNRKEGERWLQEASQQGHALASYALGQLYANRRDVLAVEITRDSFKKAAEQGFPFAAFELGKAYASRFPPPPLAKDDVAACSWFLIASALDQRAEWQTQRGLGLAEMRKELPDRLAKARQNLTPDRLSDCERISADWLSAHRSP